MKVPTKDELYNQVEALQRENSKLQHQLEAEERKRWERNKDKAVAVFFSSVPFPSTTIRNVSLDHTDASGYWFSFELENDRRRQTYAVRHTDIGE